jgi:hypothetical protein
MKEVMMVLAMALLLAAAPSSRACTIFVGVKADTVLVGNNLDAPHYFPRLWIIPESEGKYARICFGIDDEFRTAEGGMNDQGLYISVNALDEDTGWKPDQDLADWEEWSGWYGTGVPDGILASCATVEEAILVFETHNLFTLGRVKFLIADKTGASAVIEWHAGRLRVLRRSETPYQISTNFVQSAFAPDSIPCQRYRIADEMLGTTGSDPSIDGFRGVLSATHLEFRTPTIYSNICNLTTGDIHIYYFHNFEEVRAMNLSEEAGSGRAEYLVRDLFEVKPYVATVYEGFSGER